MTSSRRFIRHLFGLGLAMAALGCGTASNNDQGVSFLNFGFFAVDEEGKCSEDGVTGGLFFLGNSARSLSTCVGVQNNLSGQFIQSNRATISYFVPGAAVQPPSVVVPFTNILGPGSTGANTTLPDGVKNESSVIAGLTLITTDIWNFLVLNQRDLPNFPYTMIATVTVSGITSAGDRLDTNSTEIGIEVRREGAIEVTPPA